MTRRLMTIEGNISKIPEDLSSAKLEFEIQFDDNANKSPIRFESTLEFRDDGVSDTSISMGDDGLTIGVNTIAEFEDEDGETEPNSIAIEILYKTNVLRTIIEVRPNMVEVYTNTIRLLGGNGEIRYESAVMLPGSAYLKPDNMMDEIHFKTRFIISYNNWVCEAYNKPELVECSSLLTAICNDMLTTVESNNSRMITVLRSKNNETGELIGTSEITREDKS